MKCLTLHAHWAEAVFALGKDVENRTWTTSFRGPIAIHAGSRVSKTLCHQLGLDPRVLTTGAIIGTVELVDIVKNSRSLWAMNSYYHWIICNPLRLALPVVRRGQLGLFNIPNILASSRRIGPT